MACYVDGMRPTPKTRAWPYQQACHLVCDTGEQLDEIAECIGLRPAWKQKPLTPSEHYDLTTSMRRRAVQECGAIQTTLRGVGRVMQQRRKRWPR